MTEDAKYIYPRQHYIEYDAYGGILRYGVAAIGYVEDMVTQGGNWILDVSDVDINMRVNTATKEIEPKTACSATVEGTTISNLPIPCRVMVGFNHFEVDDGILELDLVQPGVYTVIVRSRTHLDGKYEVISEG